MVVNDDYLATTGGKVPQTGGGGGGGGSDVTTQWWMGGSTPGLNSFVPLNMGWSDSSSSGGDRVRVAPVDMEIDRIVINSAGTTNTTRFQIQRVQGGAVANNILLRETGDLVSANYSPAVQDFDPPIVIPQGRALAMRCVAITNAAVEIRHALRCRMSTAQRHVRGVGLHNGSGIEYMPFAIDSFETNPLEPNWRFYPPFDCTIDQLWMLTTSDADVYGARVNLDKNGTQVWTTVFARTKDFQFHTANPNIAVSFGDYLQMSSGRELAGTGIGTVYFGLGFTPT